MRQSPLIAIHRRVNLAQHIVGAACIVRGGSFPMPVAGRPKQVLRALVRLERDAEIAESIGRNFVR